ncbi:hypothetical protein [Pseudonocardia sp. NPDC049154]|uniref:hypothetical protein n=1 Tax=Pseudonocardia sp. NPDC049154 TaxID=3155501 RepID=UPI0033EC9844
MFGAGLLWFLGTPAEPRRRLRGLAFMLAAMLLHGLWDSAIGIGTTLLGGSTPLVFGYWIVVAVLAVATVVTAFRLAVPRERGFVRAVLAPEVSAGVLTEEELATLSDDAKARRAYRRAAHGYERRRRHHRLAAAHELADELAHAGGEETSRVIHAREELARFASA